MGVLRRLALVPYACAMLSALRKHTTDPAKPSKKRQYPEADAQKRIVKWLRDDGRALPMRVENASKRTPAQYQRDRLMGMEPGAPDLLIGWKKGLFFVEMKDTNGELSSEQAELHHVLRRMGVLVLVCYGFEDAQKQISEVLDG